MMEQTIFVRTYAPEDPRLTINPRELWRYAGYRGMPEDPALLQAADEVMQTIRPLLAYRVCWRLMPVSRADGRLLSPLETDSRQLQRLLGDCRQAVVMAATVGLGIDRCIARWGHSSPLRALLAQGFGAERIEALCDAFCADIAAESCTAGQRCTPRFSPGYGDLPLETQPQIFRLLDCSKYIGLSLNDSLLMSPSKSVTAVFGIRHAQADTPREHACAACTKTDCIFRQE